MIKIINKLLSVILAASMVALLSQPVYGADSNFNDIEADNIVTVDYSYETALSNADIEKYTAYLPQIPLVDRIEACSEDLLAYCTHEEYVHNEKFSYETFTMDDYLQLIPCCASIKEIVKINSLLYIRYITTDGHEVIVTYSGRGIEDFCIYDSAEDCAICVRGDHGIKYENFRYGKSCIVTKDSDNDVAKFDDSEHLYYDENLRATKTNFDLMLESLQSDFPYINDTQAFVRYSSALGANRDVRVVNQRNAYTVLSTDYRSFAL